MGILYLATKSQRHRAISGMEGLIGAEGVVKTELNPEGSVLIHGEIWNAQGDGNISAGEKVVVNAVEGLKLKVKPAKLSN